ncbi:Pol polyprotein [Caligus rogercresseyi]|uniref:Pol polyprotein n=1 Tax=Caligus rogercresseyi TaxID=217165 RepID=A0A7T8HHE3_CALRO|nr:Pol polyprotein [Caligus rogercresseyi]
MPCLATRERVGRFGNCMYKWFMVRLNLKVGALEQRTKVFNSEDDRKKFSIKGTVSSLGALKRREKTPNGRQLMTVFWRKTAPTAVSDASQERTIVPDWFGCASSEAETREDFAELKASTASGGRVI